MKKHWKLLLFVGIEFLVVITIVLLTLFAGRKTYTVTFDLNGGTYISGNLTQTVRHGQSAIPPEVTKDGAYLLDWSESYKQITKDVVISAVWEYETSYGIEFEYIGNSNYCLISGCYENISGDVYIGSFYNGMRVLGIKDGAFKDCQRITGIYLLDGLVSIGTEAFSGCTNLKTIDIPSTVEVIGDDILKGCTKLEKMSVPFVGDALGETTNNFFGYFFGASNYSFNKKYVPETLKEVFINGSADIPAKSFYNCVNISKITFSDRIKKIDSDAFRNCSGLSELVISDSIEAIEATAFVNCSGLTKIILGDNVTTISSAAFANCTSLKEVYISEKVESISENAFQNCTSLTKFDVDKNNNHFVVTDGLLYILTEEAQTIYQIDYIVYEDDFADFSDILIEIGKIEKPIFRPTKGEDGLFKDKEDFIENPDLEIGNEDLIDKPILGDNEE